MFNTMLMLGTYAILGSSAKKSAAYLVNQLSMSDTFAIYVYSSVVTKVYPALNSFAPGTKAHRMDAIGAINHADVKVPGSDPGLAIKNAFDAFDAGDSGESVSGCGIKAIVLLTDTTMPYVTEKTDVIATIKVREMHVASL